MNLSTKGANPIMKAGKERPNACWVCERARGGSRHAPPSEGRSCIGELRSLCGSQEYVVSGK